MPPRRARTRLHISLTIAGAFLVYLAGNGGASLFDRDEPRYAQCSREMIQGSPEHPGPDYVVPRHLGELRYAKPAGIYWCQAAAMKLFGNSGGAGAFAARFPSAVAMPITLVLVVLGVWRWAGAGRAGWTVLVLATSVMTILAAKACLTDSVLLLWITVAQGCLYLIWRGRAGWGTWAVMGVAMGAAAMIKGPVVLGVTGMTGVALIALRFVDQWLARWAGRNRYHAPAQNEPNADERPRTNEPTAPAPNEPNANQDRRTNEPTETAFFGSRTAIDSTNSLAAAPNEATAAAHRRTNEPIAPAPNEPNANRPRPTNEPTTPAPNEPNANRPRPTNEPTAPAQNEPNARGSVITYRPTPPVRWSVGRFARVPRLADPISSGTQGLRLAFALLLMLAVVAPWLYLINEREPSFIPRSIGHDVVNRIKTGLEGHSGPPGYHLVTIWGTYLPWSILLPMTIVFAWKRRHLAPVRFALAAVLGPWVMFEVVQTKLPHYMLPVFPFLAFLTADAIVRCLRGQHDDMKRQAFVRAAAVWAAILGILACGPLVLSLCFRQSVGVSLLLLPVGWAYVGTVVYLFAARRPAHGLVAMGAGMLLVLGLLWTVFLPHSDPMRLSIRVADVLKREGATGAGQVVMLDFKEPTLAFYQGGTIRENSATALSDVLVDAAPPWLVITKEVWNSPLTSASARDRLEVVESVDGLAYADGMRRVTVMVVRKRK